MVYALLAAFVIFLGVLLCRAAAFRPKDNVKVISEAEDFDKEITVSRLQKLIRFKTVSYRDASLEDEKEFRGLLDSLPELYPNVFKTCEYKEMADRAILFRWKGETDGDPLGHDWVVDDLSDSEICKTCGATFESNPDQDWVDNTEGTDTGI
ncbi:MAG: hypothetical protein J6V50_05460, partial [Clostridia bacterium]|nr:hypothetical protein [Clostridia bacterium]